jgi:predicted DNA-binding transcriptional regulator YafY
MYLEVAITPELVQWILGFGPNAVVIKPQALKNRVLTEVQLLLEKYNSRKAA